MGVVSLLLRHRCPPASARAALLLGALLAAVPAGRAGDLVVVGKNANIIGPPVAIDSVNRIEDRGLRQQNEPSCAVNPENPQRMCCGFNDYRGVDIPGLGDAWEGIACSIDGGDSWHSELIPGHRNDPQYSLDLDFAADPNLVGVPGGLVFNYIAADRDQIGGLYVQRYAWRNREDGWPIEPVGGPVLVSKGNSGRFIDKPHAHGFVNDAGGDPVVWNWTNGEGPQSRELPAGSLGVSAAVFVGNDNNDGTKILYWRSDDWGATWKQPTKLTESVGVNSGVHLAARNSSDLCAVWRRFDDTNETSAVMFACSGDAGRRFSKPKAVRADICPFDQTTLNGLPPVADIVSFRTNAFPVLATDGDRYYAFWSDRGYAAASDGPEGCNLIETDPVTGEDRFNESFARIVYATSSNGKSWSSPRVVEDFDGISVPGQEVPFAGHQFMPAAFGANGQVVLAWIDTREDIVNAFRSEGFDPAIDRQLVVDLWGESDGASQGLYRHSADIRAVRLRGGEVLGASTRVSQYANGLLDLGAGQQLLQLEYNLVNARLFQNGMAPFIGDYLDVAASAFNQDEQGNWKNSNTRPSAGGVFHVGWGGNRDVRGNAWGVGDFATASPYTPAEGVIADGAAQSTGEVANANPSVEDDPVQNPQACTPGTAGAPAADRTRDQNVYSAALYPEFTLASPGAIKLSGTGITGTSLQRAIPVLVENHGAVPRELELRVTGQPAGNGIASFSQFKPETIPAVRVKVWPRSSAVRTVFVTTDEELQSTGITLIATACGASGCGGDPVAEVILNEDPLALEQPVYGSSSVQVQETHDPAILNPGLLNPDVVRLLILDPGLLDILKTAGQLSPAFTLADLFNPGLVDAATLDLLEQFPNLLNPQALDPGLLALLLENPQLLNRRLLLADLANPAYFNPNLLNPNLLNEPLWDLLRTGDNLALLLEGVEDPAFLDRLAANPEQLNPDLLNLIVANPNLLNPNLLNILVANPNLLNFELLNPNLLNPNLLNLLVSNPNLLNASVSGGLLDIAADPGFPVGAGVPEQLAWVQSNYAQNSELVEAVFANPNLLNPNLLNPNLLNPNLLNQLVANPNLLNPNLLNPNLLNPNLLNPNLLNPNLLNPDLLNPDLLNVLLADPELFNLVVANPNLLNPNLLNPNLLNPNLLNQIIANPNLLNPNLLNPNLLNPNLLNPNLLNATLDSYGGLQNPEAAEAPPGVSPGEDFYIDVTWQVQNRGNTTTGYMAQPYLAGAEQPGGTEGVSGTQLIVSKPYLRQTVVDCQQVLQTYNNVLVNIPNPRLLAPIENPDPTDPATAPIVQQLGSFWLAPGEVANVTLRTFGAPEALVSGRAGLYINSEACTSGVADNVCATLLPFAVVERDFTAPVFEPLDAFYAQFELPIEANGPGGATLEYVEPVATDEGDGGPVPVICDFPPGASFPLGISDHSCTAGDSAGNLETIEFQVEIVDTIAPLLSIQPDALVLPVRVEATGPEGSSYDFADFGGWELSSLDLVDPQPGIDCALVDAQDPGAAAIPLAVGPADSDGRRFFTQATDLELGFATFDLRCTSTDVPGGNTSEELRFDSAIVVDDTTAPQLSVPTDPVLVSASSPSEAVAAFSLSVSDVVGVVSRACYDPAGNEVVSGQTPFPLGATTVTCVASDARGNSGQVQFEVQVIDTGTPQLNLPANGVFPAGLHPTDPALPPGYQLAYSVTASDAFDPDVDVACTPPPGWFPEGLTRVDCSATDDAGNSASGFFLVTVQDSTAPSVTPPADMLGVEAQNAAGALVAYSFTAEDDLDPSLSASCADGTRTDLPASTPGVQFPLGTTTVTCVFSDDDGNSAGASFTVEVVDTTPPFFTALPEAISAIPMDASGAVVEFEVSAQDAGGVSEPVSVVCRDQAGATVMSGSLFPIGVTTVTCTAADQAGNTAAGSFPITVGAGIVWLSPPENGSIYRAGIGPTLGLVWGYGTADNLLDSGDFIDRPRGKGTAPLAAYYLGPDAQCAGNDLGIVDLDAGRSSLRYKGREWRLNWQTGQSRLDLDQDGVSDSDLLPGCYRLEIPRASGPVDQRLFLLD